jgi:CheY-like chemotaxis protein/anti-sigma regulatory factor (Ser/Thr protein kinase)
MGSLEPQQRDAVVAIVSHAQQLHAVVERIGTLMEVQVQTEADTAPTALGDLVTAVVETRRPAAAQAGLELEARVEQGLPLVAGNPLQLKQAVDCLLDNALKFTPRGGRVEVRAYSESGVVCLVVADTGIGMEAEELEHIFDPFYQVEGSPTRRYGGLGLGLTVAKAVVEAHGGELDVQSRPGAGSQFTVRLAPSADQTYRPVESRPRRRRILLVDDEEFVTKSLQAGLEKLQTFEVVAANSGAEALRLLEEEPFDLLIADYKMPGVDGLMLADQVRHLYPQTAVVMLTAYGSDWLREQAESVAIRQVLDKPVRLAQIRRVAVEMLGEGQEAD